MDPSIDALLKQIKSIHALDDLLPASISSLLFFELVEIAEPNNRHPRRIFVGVPKDQQPSSAQIASVRLSIPRLPGAPFDQIIWLEPNLPARVSTDLLIQYFGQPIDFEPSEPPFTTLYWKYADGRRFLHFEIEKDRLKQVIITKTDKHET